jgi:hypothetical protein
MLCHSFNMWEIYYEFLTLNPSNNKFTLRNKKVKLSLWQAVDAHRDLRRRGSHIL